MTAVVVGGTYRETCSEPDVDRVLGSGVRGAAVLGAKAEYLVTVACEQDLQACGAAIVGKRVIRIPRHGTIQFAYDTPLSPPRLLIDPSDRFVEVPPIQADNAVVFGMVEARPIVRAQRAVVDPQHSLKLDDFGSTIQTDELVVVANRRETYKLTGDWNLRSAAQLILGRTGAIALVVKCGAQGALVFTPDNRWQGVPAYATEEVAPIGSGDVFTAALAAHYLEHGDLVASAHAASKRTAAYVWKSQLRPLELGDLALPVETPSLRSVQEPPMVYVAGSFENPEQRWSVNTIASGIDDICGRSLSPLRDFGPKGDPRVTAQKDLDALDACDAVVLLADVARTGPFFEAGWATRIGLPVIVISTDQDKSRFTMLRGTDATFVSDFATAAYRAVWAAIDHQQVSGRAGRLLLLSGGLDSAAIAAVEQPARALFVDYGQVAAEDERAGAHAVAEYLGIELEEASVNLAGLGSGTLTGTDPVSHAPTPEWFPYRNQFLATIGAAHAAQHGLKAVILGLVEGDEERHADNTARFRASINKLVSDQEHEVRVIAPYARTPSHELLIGSDLPVEVLQLTYSCYRADGPCGECPGCSRRDEVWARAFP